MMRHRQERKYSITINCFDIGISEVYWLIHSKCTCMYPVKLGSLDSVQLCVAPNSLHSFSLVMYMESVN